MALSDKHEGKILVPWFNSHEWKYVYQLIYSENSNNTAKKEALDMLKIWKLRMPLLSSGIEGTLIVLNALLMDIEGMTEENVCLLYATSIMRFLNLCAANGRKQGTFYETARRNDLPDWLINIRHDLAHDQKVPSKFMLLHSLNFCLDWLKRKYWEVQDELVVNFVATKVVEENTDVQQYVQLCCTVIAEVRENNAQILHHLSGKCISQLKGFIRSKQINKTTSVADIIRLLCDTFMKNVDETNTNEIQKCIAEEILSTGSISVWSQQNRKSLSDSGSNTYPLWEIILQNLNDYNLLTPLIEILLNFMIDENNEDSARQYASLWLNDIFNGFLKGTGSSIKFNTVNKTILSEMKSLQPKALADPNIHTLTFLKTLLTVNCYSERYIKEVESLVTSYTKVVDESMEISNIIYTAAEVMPVSDSITVQESRITSNHNRNLCNEQKNEEDVPRKKWELVKDTSIFIGCPLGVLPNQSRTRNPLLDFKMM